MSVTPFAPLVRSGSCPVALISAVRRATRRGTNWQHIANLVAGALQDNLPGTDLLTGEQLRGDQAGYQTHLVHAEPDGAFSIAMMVWLPGQQTPLHDHVTWCVTGVLQGSEYEEVFAWRDGSLELAERRRNAPGTVSGFAPPGDIHRVRNCGSGVAVSMHVYGADLTRLGSSIRREYALPAS